MVPRARGAHEFELAGISAENHAADPKGKKLELLRESEGLEAEVTSMMAGIHGPIVDEQAITPFGKGRISKRGIESMPLEPGETLKPNYLPHSPLIEICR